jgi:hypothetical protein
MREAVRAMRRAISPRLAIRRVLMGVGEVMVLELEVEVGIVAVESAAGGRRRDDDGDDAGRRGRLARRRWWVRLRERIVLSEWCVW